MTPSRPPDGHPCRYGVVPGHALALPTEDGGVDAAIASLVLCSVSDVPAALTEIPLRR